MTNASMAAVGNRLAETRSPAARAFRIGAWRVEPRLGRLSSEAVEHIVEPKVMDVLVHLATRPGEVVSTEELVASVWRGRPMGDNPVHRCVSILRRALGDDAQRPRYIDTIPKRGYRVVAPVETVSGAPIGVDTQTGTVQLCIDVRSPVQRHAGTGDVEGAAARSVGEVLEGVLWIAGREVHVTAVLDGSPDGRVDHELRRLEIERIVSVVRSIAHELPAARQ